MGTKGGVVTMRRHRGQSTAEYAIVISVVIAAVIGMQLYLKRGMQAKVKGVTDRFTAIRQANAGAVTVDIGNGFSQYEPYYAESNLNVTQTSDATEDYNQGIFTKSGINEHTTRRGSTFQGVAVNATNNWQ